MADPSTEAPAFDPRPFLRTLTEEPGVYRMIGADDKVLYVGKAKNLKRRVSSYFQKTVSSPRIAMMVAQVLRVDITATREEIRAGDRLLPAPERTFISYTPHAPEGDVEARVVSIYGSAFANAAQVVSTWL